MEWTQSVSHALSWIGAKGILVLVVLVAMSCTPRQSELAGTYKLRGLQLVAKLELKSDGTLREVIINPNGERLEAVGSWYLEGGHLIRKPCFTFDDDHLSKAGLCTQAVQRTLAGPLIHIDPDYGIAYER